jgi:hypothetical protein
MQQFPNHSTIAAVANPNRPGATFLLNRHLWGQTMYSSKDLFNYSPKSDISKTVVGSMRLAGCGLAMTVLLNEIGYNTRLVQNISNMNS